jgi:hypothetical protein
MPTSGSKTQFAADMQQFANAAEALRIQAEELATQYFKDGFNSGGSHPIADADVAALGLTAAQIASGITECQQVGNFFGNTAVTTGDYRSTNDQLRTG